MTTTPHTPARRFLTLADVAELLNVSKPQAYALVQSGDLPAIKIGGRGQWRVEASALEDTTTRTPYVGTGEDGARRSEEKRGVRNR